METHNAPRWRHIMIQDGDKLGSWGDTREGVVDDSNQELSWARNTTGAQEWEKTGSLKDFTVCHPRWNPVHKRIFCSFTPMYSPRWNQANVAWSAWRRMRRSHWRASSCKEDIQIWVLPANCEPRRIDAKSCDKCQKHARIPRTLKWSVHSRLPHGVLT